jgi:hypothetical protein
MTPAGSRGTGSASSGTTGPAVTIDLVLGHLLEIDDVSMVGLLGAGPPPP